MKTKLLSFVLLLIVVIFSNPAKAQTVTIDYVNDSAYSFCSPPAIAYFTFTAGVTGYNANDSITLAVNFGDGSDTSVKSPIYYNQFAEGWVNHTYLSSGLFSIQYIATGPDGTADTAVVSDEVFVSTSCGNLEGRVYLDNNNDCLYNAGDSIVNDVWIQSTPNSGNPFYNYGYSDNNGNYSVNVPAGLTYDVSLIGLQNIFEYECPASGSYLAQSVPANGLDFALNCLPGFDLTGSIWGWGFVPGWNSTYVRVDAYNYRCGNVIGILKVVLDPLVSYDSASLPPTSVSGDTLIWDPYTYEHLYSNNFAAINIYTPMSPSAQLGDTVCFTVIREPIAGDSVPENNVETICYTVKSSWDPNLKDVNPRGHISNDQKLKYIVMFQNTGTASATNIFILDTLNVNLDISTFKFTGSSHPCDVTFAGNVVKFYFHNINLPDSNSNEPGSHGWVTYSMNAMPNLEIGTLIQNTAGIYFDFNDPVITNTVDNIISGATGIEAVPANGTTLLYPNPAANNAVVELAGSCDQSLISLLNVQGKFLKSWKSSGCTTTIDVSDVSEGIYFVKVKSADRLSTSKSIIAR